MCFIIFVDLDSPLLLFLPLLPLALALPLVIKVPRLLGIGVAVSNGVFGKIGRRGMSGVWRSRCERPFLPRLDF